MTTTFHRYTTPTYNGGLPAGYDLINVTSGGTGSGGSAFADGAKSGGPNAGSYFVAFGEDATSSNANRGMKALAQNCDALDDYMHRDLAIAIRTTDVTPVAPVSTVVLPSNTYLGSSAYTTSTADLLKLFHIVDENDDDIFLAGSTSHVQVTSVTLGSGDQIGGGGANGSFSGNTVTLNISPSIPTSQPYRIYYGTRSNLATLPSDAFTTIRIRGAEEVNEAVEILFDSLHGNGEAWNDPWDSTIWDLTAGGLNARYRRSSSGDAAAPEAYFLQGINEPGSGAWIFQDGPAFTVYSGSQGSYLDPINALIAVKFFDRVGTGANGNVGFVAFGARQSAVALAGETDGSSHVPGAATFMHLWPHYFTSSLHATHPYTRIVENAAATLSSTGAWNADTGEATVQVTASGNYFRDGSGNSSIALGFDLLECTYTVFGTPFVQTLVIVAQGASGDTTNVTKVRVRMLDGSVPDFTIGYAATIKWISTTMSVGDGAGALHSRAHSDVAPVLLDSFYYQVPPSLSSQGGDDNIARTPFSVSAQDNGGSSIAFQWGGFQHSAPSGPVYQGVLFGDGSLSCVTAEAAYFLREFDTIPAVTSSGTIDLDCSKGSLKILSITGGSPTSQTLNITKVQKASTIVVMLDHSANSTTQFLTWGGAGLTHRFSAGDDQPSVGAAREKWVGMPITATEIWWTLTRY